METRLRPLVLGEILDRTIQLYRSRFLLFVGIAAVPSAVVLVCFAAAIPLITSARSAGPAGAVGAGFGFLGLIAIGVPLYIFASSQGYAALTHAANLRYFGETATIRGAYKQVWQRRWQYLGLFAIEFVILGLIPFGVFFVGIVGTTGYAVAAKMPKEELGLLVIGVLFVLMALLAVYVLWLLARFGLAFPSCVIEKSSAWASLKRGIKLSEGSRWRILAVFVLGAVLGWALTWLVTMPAMIILVLIPGMKSPQHMQTMNPLFLVIDYTASFAVQALIKPIYGIALTVFYYDQRVRKEGFDIEWMMQQAGMESAPLPVSTPAPAPLNALPADAVPLESRPEQTPEPEPQA
jgi:hypothetical protein